MRWPGGRFPGQRGALELGTGNVHAAIQQHVEGEPAARLKLGAAHAAPHAVAQFDLAHAAQLRREPRALHELVFGPVSPE